MRRRINRLLRVRLGRVGRGRRKPRHQLVPRIQRQPVKQIKLKGKRMRKYFVTGLLVLVPLVITGLVLNFIIDIMDKSLLLLPERWSPEHVFGRRVPGLGVVLTLAIVFLTGLLARNFVGNYVVAFWEKMLNRIPVVNSIYSGVKKVSDTLLASTGDAFNKVLLIQYPRAGIWTLAFMTGTPSGVVAENLKGSYVSVYVPTTPNPTSGFFLILPSSEVIELDVGVDEALKYIISMGVVAPEKKSQIEVLK